MSQRYARAALCCLLAISTAIACSSASSSGGAPSSAQGGTESGTAGQSAGGGNGNTNGGGPSGGNTSSAGAAAIAGATAGGSGGNSAGAGGSADPNAVLPEDTVLTTPVPAGAILGTVTGYEMNSGCPMPSPDNCYAPLYSKYDRDDPEWWDILVDEQLLSRVNVVMAHGRGCYDLTTGFDGNGNMCPRQLSKLADAVKRAGAENVYRVAMWDDTGAYQGARNHVDKLPDGTLFDLADHTSWRFFWDYNMEIWFDTVPKELWYRIDGRPLAAFWTLNSTLFTHQQGNASLLLRDLRAKFKARYDEDPLFIVDVQWIKTDTTITPDDAIGEDSWFTPPVGNWYTYTAWNSASWGAMVPGFRLPNTVPGCGKDCWEIDRRDGAALREALTAGNSAKFSLLEGWTDIYESAGYYRSAAWTYPNEYIGGVREFADPTPETLRFQAEGADKLSTQTATLDTKRVYRPDAPNLGKLADNTGWYADFSNAAGWVEYDHVTLGCGTYRFTARVAAAAAQTLHLEVDGKSTGSVQVPVSGGLDQYALVHLATQQISAGAHTLRLVSDTGGVNFDWFFLRRSAACH